MSLQSEPPAPQGFREKLNKVVSGQRFTRFIAACISINALTLGLETFSGLSQESRTVLEFLDKVFLAIFCFEILLKLLVKRIAFFKDPWSVFDFAIVAVSLAPANEAFSVLRALRVLRTLRMISIMPSLRRVVSGLLVAVPGLGAVGAIMAILFYAGAVMSTKLFGASFPEWFGSLGASMYTLFQVMTLESWSMGIVRPVLERYPQAWIFFIPFIIVTTFTMLNLFIAVIVNALQSETDELATERENRGHAERELLLFELRELRKQVDYLSESLKKES